MLFSCHTARALAAGLPRQDHVWITTDQLVLFHKNEFDEMLCQLDSENARWTYAQALSHRHIHIRMPNHYLTDTLTGVCPSIIAHTHRTDTFTYVHVSVYIFETKLPHNAPSAVRRFAWEQTFSKPTVGIVHSIKIAQGRMASCIIALRFLFDPPLPLHTPTLFLSLLLPISPVAYTCANTCVYTCANTCVYTCMHKCVYINVYV